MPKTAFLPQPENYCYLNVTKYGGTHTAKLLDKDGYERGTGQGPTANNAVQNLMLDLMKNKDKYKTWLKSRPFSGLSAITPLPLETLVLVQGFKKFAPLDAEKYSPVIFV